MEKMYNEESRILVDSRRLVTVEVNSKGYPGKFTVVNGNVQINKNNPREMMPAAKKITAWINEMVGEKFKHPKDREFKDTLGKKMF